MSESQILQEIRELNLSYLMLAQALIRKDKVKAIFHLGVSEDVADILDGLTSRQISQVATNSNLMCRLRVEDELVWDLLTDKAKSRELGPAYNRLHSSIIQTGNFSEAA